MGIISNHKLAKKARKEARARVDEVLGKGFEAVGTTLRAKPKYVPLFIWILPYFVVFKTRAVRFAWQYLKSK